MGALNLGALEVSIALPNTIPTAMMGSDVAFQSVVWDTTINLGNWSNAQAVHL